VLEPPRHRSVPGGNGGAASTFHAFLKVLKRPGGIFTPVGPRHGEHVQPTGTNVGVFGVAHDGHQALNDVHVIGPSPRVAQQW
jgi:hypothetical protein